MEYNLTAKQKDVLRWMVESNRRDELDEEFIISWVMGPTEYLLMNSVSHTQAPQEGPEITKGVLDALESVGLIQQQINYEIKTRRSGSSKNPRTSEREVERSRRCSLNQSAYDAIDSDFVMPDSSPTSAAFHFHGNVSQSIIGTQDRAELTNNFNSAEVREQIEREGGEDREALHEALSRIESLLNSGEHLERGSLSDFSGVMERHSWFTGAVTSALLGFATQFIG